MSTPNLFRGIPSVHELLDSPPLRKLVDQVSHRVVADGARTFLDDLRIDLQKKAHETIVPSMAELAEKIARRILSSEQPSLQSVVNATGVLLHTGLGRAPLAEEAIASMNKVARDYASVELDLATGKRSQRLDSVTPLLAQLTGAEDALVVNNNAAATLLALAALTADREVIVSRGQLVEIGGSYRLPDVLEASGARLREVGTTNKTHLSDYEQAINEQTGALLRVHTSNYRVVGFTAEVELERLVSLGRERGLPVIDDVGSGALFDFSQVGCQGEPRPMDSIAAGADLVLFSGDKLLGGPQAGIAVGRRALIKQMLGHPLARALRVDKLTLAALAATLRLYRDMSAAEQKIPLLQLITTPLENLRNRAERLAPQLAACQAVAAAEPVEDVAYLGGGSVPEQQLASWCIALTPQNDRPDQLAERLRTATPAVVGRVQRDRLLIDLRSVFPRQDQLIVQSLQEVASSPSSGAAESTSDSAVSDQGHDEIP